MTARKRKVVALPASVTAGASALSARESFKRAIASAAEAADDMFELKTSRLCMTSPAK